MEFALCAPFLEEELWADRLRRAALPHGAQVTACNSPESLVPVLERRPFALAAVALNGPAGMEAVRRLRERDPRIPLLWISDGDYSLAGYQYRVTYFLCGPVEDAALRRAVACCLGAKKKTLA